MLLLMIYHTFPDVDVTGPMKDISHKGKVVGHKLNNLWFKDSTFVIPRVLGRKDFKHAVPKSHGVGDLMIKHLRIKDSWNRDHRGVILEHHSNVKSRVIDLRLKVKRIVKKKVSIRALMGKANVRRDKVNVHKVKVNVRKVKGSLHKIAQGRSQENISDAPMASMHCLSWSLEIRPILSVK